MLTSEQKTLIKATVPILREHGVALTSHFYQRMFSHNPELKNIFNMGNQQTGKQQMALAMAVLAYAENIEDPSVLLPAVSKIGQKHTSLDIRAEHYPIVGKHLIGSISEVLGEAASPEILDAWSQAYDDLANIFIGYERGLYRKTTSAGGWSGWRPFLVKKKVAESTEISSFYLYPSDGGKPADFIPGQYISVRIFLPEKNIFQTRQYSISTAQNGEYYRISVKKEGPKNETPGGLVSNYLHSSVNEGEMIEVASPAGDFTLRQDSTAPAVFISGGIGQTPLLSMIESIVHSGSQRQVVWVHGCRDCQVHAFDELVNSFVSKSENIKKIVFYERKVESDTSLEGIADLNQVKDEVLLPGAEYYICGPSGFIEKQYADLRQLGVDAESIFYEEFGPHVLRLEAEEATAEASYS